LEEEQERRGKTERTIRARGISPQIAGTETSVAEEAGNAFSADDNRAYSDGESGEDKDGDGIFSTESSVCSKEPICHGY